MENKIPLRINSLPTSFEIYSYLKSLDTTKWYSNFGFLNNTLEKKIAEYHEVGAKNVVCVNNCTTGLDLALLSVNQDSEKKYCLLPSFTFAATPAAVISAGMIPYFLDISTEEKTLTPEIVSTFLKEKNISVGAVVPVSFFGKQVPTKGWDNFTLETGIPVVIDSAWSFGSLEPGLTPNVVSLHATKKFGIGEGAFILSLDSNLIGKVKQRANFGFNEARVSTEIGKNGKMSEFQAAVGLAAFDNLNDLIKKNQEVSDLYKKYFPENRNVKMNIHGNSENFPGTLVLEFKKPIASVIEEKLNSMGVESRRWWGLPCHKHDAFTHYSCTKMENTMFLADAHLNIPFFPSMTESQIRYVCTSLSEIFENENIGEILG